MTEVYDALRDLFAHNMFFGLTVTLGGYFLGIALRKKLPILLFTPLLVSIIVIIVSLKLFKIDYTTYKTQTYPLSYLLTPSTICLAIPLYRQFELVKKNWRAILAAIVAGTASNVLIVWTVALCFHLEYRDYVTFLTKSITTAIGVGVTEELGGNVPITCAVIALSGIVGNALGDRVLRLCRLYEPIAQGLGIGVASHGIGTTRALELGETQGAFSGLAIALTGLLTVLIAPFAALLPL
ncbi:MAG: LrgB family protein [Thermoguttaceae bacterium]|nr:LrgB family protein [Thermoguttaceae bacterium]